MPEQPIDSYRNVKSYRRQAKRSGLGYTRPDDEDTVWRSEVRRKGASGGLGERHEVHSSIPDMCERNLQCLRYRYFFTEINILDGV